MPKTKYIFFTGGVVSSLGKGIAAASLGVLLKHQGYNVTIQKFDPYLNVDPGTMSLINMVKYLLLMMGVKPIWIWVTMNGLLIRAYLEQITLHREWCIGMC